MQKSLLFLLFLGILGGWVNAVPFTVSNVVWKDPVNVTISGNSLTKTNYTSWSGDAISTVTISANTDAYVETTAQEGTTARMFGFSDANTDSGYTSIDYAFYLYWSNQIYVYESGAQIGNFGTYNTGDVVRVQRTNGVITYSKNGVVFYTSTLLSTTQIIVDTSLYNVGSTISNAVLGIGNVPEPSSLLLLGLMAGFLGLKSKILAPLLR